MGGPCQQGPWALHLEDVVSTRRSLLVDWDAIRDVGAAVVARRDAGSSATATHPQAVAPAPLARLRARNSPRLS
jgi:hypothetical protein